MTSDSVAVNQAPATDYAVIFESLDGITWREVPGIDKRGFGIDTKYYGTEVTGIASRR
jgi:hypothetical protein